ncbi:MAG: chemotaxis response regulator protein-glutamate methylesterase [Methanosarcinales archaeon]|jgi:two-component system chemotaxis response regulator CheB|nr:chemotaxis response regulator protein-glutamate methylesterase [Methanosarcinales archaeon]
MIGKIKVLVVDDSAFMRVLISDMISEDDGIEVIGIARNGKEGVLKANSLMPDVITMDVEMPKMNGIEALRLILSERKVPIIMLSALTKKGADTTLEALNIGAFDFITKPSGTISLDIESVKSILISKIKDAYANRKNIALFSNKQSSSIKNLTVKSNNHLDFTYGDKKVHRIRTPTESKLSKKVVIIGASTGGPKALHEIFSELPQDLDACVLAVQHMPPFFTQSLSERLDKASQLIVKEGSNQEQIVNGSAFVAPGDFHMIIRYKKLLLNKGPHLHAIRPAIDITMESVALNYGSSVIGVILTGMGKDGAMGISAIKKAGGTTIACDEQTSVIFGMPKEAINTGYVDYVLPLHRIARKIIKQVDA